MTWGLADWQACPIGGQTGLKMLPRLTRRTQFPDGPTGLVSPMQPAGAMFRRMTGLPNTARRRWCPETASCPERKTLQPVTVVNNRATLMTVKGISMTAILGLPGSA